ncbi:ovochymase-2 isoform X2 [Ascaphus truei]|uniref:ovochymase-2 isoform X2 n=1 Tax=Ascaphus truei TaxID=8439 RepID=UPI003F5A8439
MPARKRSIGTILLTLAWMAFLRKGDSGPLDPGKACRCGELTQHADKMNYNIQSRIVGGKSATKGQHPWIASLKRNGQHFCGGTIVSSTYVVTAAHCVSDRNVLSYLQVFIGDFDLTAKEPEEKRFSIKTIIRHPNFKPSQPINFDIAVLELDGNITFDENIQPACLPNPDDLFDPGFLCVALGWGRLGEGMRLASSLQEVSLPLIESRQCLNVMATIKGIPLHETILCAGFPEGGKDACQGDSGGPLLCRRTHGSWVLVGLTSWGMGCGRKWANNRLLIPAKRGSPGIFTDILKLLPWVNVNLNTEKYDVLGPQARCSVRDGVLTGTGGQIILPGSPREHYANNEMCVWRLSVPAGMQVLLNFSRFDVEEDVSCNLDYLAVYSAETHLLGKFCGAVCPVPILISSARVTLKFISDFQEYRTGFELSYSALALNTYPESGCGSVSIHLEEGEIQSMRYPGKYTNLANCHWVFHAPKDHRIKLTFEDFEIEPSERCDYDAVTVYQDLVGEGELGKYCGDSLPPSLITDGNVMQIKFRSDKAGTYRGFRASVAFVGATEFIQNSASWKGKGRSDPRNQLDETDRSDTRCGASPIPPRFISTRIVGGEEAMPYSWPWHVSLQFAAEHACDGSIVAEGWVLTAASCVVDRAESRDLWLVVAGLHDLTASEHNQKRPVCQIVIHPEFNRVTMDYDIALIQLTEPFQFNSYIRPICLPERSRETEPSSLCIVTGWGIPGEGEEKSTKLQQLEVPVLVADACRAHYADHPGGITDRMFCAGFPTGQAKDSCTGEPGGPLVCLLEDSGSYSIFGIVSWGVGCRENGKPGVYTNVPVFIDWINQIVNGSGHKESDLVEDLTSLIRPNDEEKVTKANDNIFKQEDAASNSSWPAANIYFASGCEDVVLMQSPGEIRLDTKGQIYPEGFSCQWRIIAPKDKQITLRLQQFHMSAENRECCKFLMIYEGMSTEKALKAQFSEEMVPCTVSSAGSALTVKSSTTLRVPDVEFCLEYSFHDRN